MRPLCLLAVSALAASACFSARDRHLMKDDPGTFLAEHYDPLRSSTEKTRADYAYDDAVAEAERIDAGYYSSEPCPTSANPKYADADAVEKRRLQVLCRRRAELLDAGALQP